MSNPLSGHTAAQGFTGGSGLRDGDGLTSPSLTNPYEGLHGNGLLRVADGAYGATRNATGSSTEGHVAVGAGGTITVSGGYAVLDGVIYEFGGGLGGTHTTTVIGTTTNYVGSLPTPHASVNKEAYVVIYVAAMGANDNIMYEFGTLADPATETPQVPNTFLSTPGPANNQQATVLAVLHYTVSAGGALTASLNTPTVHDKRTFIRPNPVYFNHLTAGAAGSVVSTDAIDNTNQVTLDSIFASPSDGDFTSSPFGSVWQTHSPDGNSVLLYSAQRDIGGVPTRNTWRLSPNEVKEVTTGTNQSFTFDGPNIWVITPSSAINLNPQDSFPHGHIIDVINKGSNNITFDSTVLAQVVAPGEGFRFVYTGSAWKEILIGSASPTVASGVSGLVQLSDGAGGFTSDTDLLWDAGAGELIVDGKLTVTGLIDPTGLELDPQATNPGGVAANTLWLDSGASNRPKIGTAAVMRGGDDISELNNDAGFTDAAAASAAAPVQSVNTATGAVVLDADDIDDTSTTNKFTTAADISKLAGIATGADVTDTASVRAAGALMDDEVTNLADVKAFDPANYATAAQGVSADTAFGWGDHAGLYATAAQGATADTALQTVAVDGTTITGDGTVGNPLVATPSGAAGAIQFSDGVAFASDDANLHFDNANNRLGLGTASPQSPLHVVINDLNEALRLETTDATVGTDSAPDIAIITAKGTTGDYLGGIYYKGQNSASAQKTYSSVFSRIDNATSGAEAGSYFVQNLHKGANRTFMFMEGHTTATGRTTFNYNAQDIDFAILNESGVGGYGLFHDASLGRIGIGTLTPSTELHVEGTIRQTNATNAVLVADSNGDLVAATNLTDTAYSTTDTTDAAADNYAANPAYWVGGPPTTVAQALDRIAAWLNNPAFMPGPIP